MMKVEPANRDLGLLKPHFKLVRTNEAYSRWEAAAGLNHSNGKFCDEVAYAVIRFLTGSVAAAHRALPADRKALERQLKRDRKAKYLIAQSCRLYGENVPSYLEAAVKEAIDREVVVERAIAQLGVFKRGKQPYREFARLVRSVGVYYRSATNKAPIVKFNNARGAGERCSGHFAELIEAAFAVAELIWRRSRIKAPLSLFAPNSKGQRLDYARKELQPKRAKRRSA
jgi:hypothetical protein